MLGQYWPPDSITVTPLYTFWNVSVCNILFSTSSLLVRMLSWAPCFRALQTSLWVTFYSLVKMLALTVKRIFIDTWHSFQLYGLLIYVFIWESLAYGGVHLRKLGHLPLCCMQTYWGYRLAELCVPLDIVTLAFPFIHSFIVSVCECGIRMSVVLLHAFSPNFIKWMMTSVFHIQNCLMDFDRVCYRRPYRILSRFHLYSCWFNITLSLMNAKI